MRIQIRKSVVSNIDVFMCMLYDALINNVCKQTHGGKDSHTFHIAQLELLRKNTICVFICTKHLDRTEVRTNH